jgi:hypothetical protein
LIDTNVWRYIVENDELESLYRAAKHSQGVILACPAVLYEMLRTGDTVLRKQLVRAICRARWQRMMPDAYEESMELFAEISRLRSHWLLPTPDERRFNDLRNDWASRSGVWRRSQADPSRVARTLRLIEGDFMSRARDDAYQRRDDFREVLTFEMVTLDRWTTTFPLEPDGWDGEPVETWRAATLAYYVEAWFSTTPQSTTAQEWLEPRVDLAAVLRELPSFARLLLYETEADRLPRNWLRWAFSTLQATLRASPGTPADTQIGSYLKDADCFVTADKTFVAIVRRIRDEGNVVIAEPIRVTPSDSLDALLSLLAG